MNIILITGAGSGIGYETAVSLKAQGHKIYGGIRSQQAADGGPGGTRSGYRVVTH